MLRNATQSERRVFGKNSQRKVDGTADDSADELRVEPLEMTEIASEIWKWIWQASGTGKNLVLGKFWDAGMTRI